MALFYERYAFLANCYEESKELNFCVFEEPPRGSDRGRLTGSSNSSTASGYRTFAERFQSSWTSGKNMNSAPFQWDPDDYKHAVMTLIGVQLPPPNVSRYQKSVSTVRPIPCRSWVPQPPRFLCRTPASESAGNWRPTARKWNKCVRCFAWSSTCRPIWSDASSKRSPLPWRLLLQPLVSPGPFYCPPS